MQVLFRAWLVLGEPYSAAQAREVEPGLANEHAVPKSLFASPALRFWQWPHLGLSLISHRKVWYEPTGIGK